ncbi:MAG: hypothetical protein WCC39_08695, partial [Telluria sp.]
ATAVCAPAPPIPPLTMTAASTAASVERFMPVSFLLFSHRLIIAHFACKVTAPPLAGCIVVHSL